MIKEVREGCSFCGKAYKDGDEVAFALVGTYHLDCGDGTRAARMRKVKAINRKHHTHNMIAVFAYNIETARIVVANHVEQEHKND